MISNYHSWLLVAISWSINFRIYEIAYGNICNVYTNAWHFVGEQQTSVLFLGLFTLPRGKKKSDALSEILHISGCF